MAIMDDILAMLDELVKLTTLDEESPQSFKVRAYENARNAIEAQGTDISQLTVTELTKIQGVGKATANKIREYVDTGTVAKLEDLRAAYPPAFVELGKIPGLGPKTLKLVRSELGVEDLDGLKAAIAAEQLRTLPRMGAQSEAKIAKAIDRLGLSGKDRRTPIGEALPLARRLVDDLRQVDTVADVAYCGSLRRLAETIGDVDITVAATDGELVMAAVRGHAAVRELVLSGSTKTSFLTSTGLQVDVRVVAPEQFGAATLYFTGSKTHNIALRQRAINQGMLLNEYGLFAIDDEGNPGDVVAADTEHAIYAALGLPYIEPPMRENTGEVEAAANDRLPDVVQLADIKGDLHYHSDRSGDGRSSLEDMVQAAADRGYAYVALTEHAEDLGINGANREQLLAHRDRIRALQDAYPDMSILYGCELNIGPTGGLDYDAEFRAGFDYTVASVHTHFDAPMADQTARMVAAIADPCVDSIGHLTGRAIGRRPGIELDIDIVLEALFTFDVALEVSGGLNRLDAAPDVIRRAVDRGVKLVINSDSHHTSDLGRMLNGVRNAQRGWAPKDQIINTWPRDRFLTWVADHRNRPSPA